MIMWWLVGAISMLLLIGFMVGLRDKRSRADLGGKPMDARKASTVVTEAKRETKFRGDFFYDRITRRR